MHLTKEEVLRNIALKEQRFIDRLRNVSVRDGFLVYSMFGQLKRNTTIYELYPAYNRHLLDAEYALADKLHANAFNIYKAKQRRESAIFKSYTSLVEDRFAEFDSRVIWRYFHVAKNGYLMGTYPFDLFKLTQDDFASICLSMGEYSTVALIDKRCSFVSELRDADIKQALSDNSLYKLFPHLLQDQGRVVQIQTRIDALVNYCKFIAPNCSEEICNDLQDKKDQLKQQNPGFHSVSYTIAWNWAEASINDWKYISFDPELENFFAPFEFSPQAK